MCHKTMTSPSPSSNHDRWNATPTIASKMRPSSCSSDDDDSSSEIPTRIPRQCLRRNSKDITRETPSRAPSQSMRRNSDLSREMRHINQSLQAMSAFVNEVEQRPGAEKKLQAHLRRSLPPTLPRRQTSVARLAK